MKTVYIVRHAKAEPGGPDVPDFGRTLTDKGRDDALEAAEYCLEKEAIPMLIISSPAKRALETARIFAKTLGFPQNRIKRPQSLYGQGSEAMLDILREQDESIDSVMLVGHNPTVSDAANRLDNSFIENMPTSGVVGIQCDVAGWSDIVDNCGSVVLHESLILESRPRTYKELRKLLAGRIMNAATAILREYDVETVNMVDSDLDALSKDMAKAFTKKLRKKNRKK